MDTEEKTKVEEIVVTPLMVSSFIIIFCIVLKVLFNEKIDIKRLLLFWGSIGTIIFVLVIFVFGFIVCFNRIKDIFRKLIEKSKPTKKEKNKINNKKGH